MTMTNLEKINLTLSYLKELFPYADCQLHYQKDYELLIAVMLSAQTTDKAVNKVTDVLFSKYPSLDLLDKASLSDIEEIIKSIGLYKNKAKNIKGITKSLIDEYDGKLPSDNLELTKLPGVGNKTAAVVRAVYFHIPELPVDTHIMRIAKRLKLAKPNDDPNVISDELKKLVPINKWIKTHHQLIFLVEIFVRQKILFVKIVKYRIFAQKNRDLMVISQKNTFYLSPR